jgi:hypothetical protein
MPLLVVDVEITTELRYNLTISFSSILILRISFYVNVLIWFYLISSLVGNVVGWSGYIGSDAGLSCDG